ncbi:MAG: acyltransferase family protein [Bacteriovoracaceae bacterium]|jgi:1-acyl-sn-glycerol-3-phosphate acyltransferase|nr:acyltransferase family protein [Bacteriovoracaceae bacterium]
MIKMLKNFRPRITSEEQKHFDQVFKTLKSRYNEDNPDPWGLDVDTCRKMIDFFYPMYRNYFKVRIFGAENVENKPYMVTANHTGQIAFDGILLTLAFSLDIDPPRILRGMVERFLSSIPFAGEFLAKGGSVLGDRQNCLWLLEREESILVFPEGVRGINKNTDNFYNLQSFGKGFFRLALKTGTDVLPVAVVGAEEAYPLVYNAKKLAGVMGLPSFPVTPTWPLMGPFGAIPLPTQIDIYIGKPYKMPSDLSPDAPDSKINEHVMLIENQIKEMIEKGLPSRRGYSFNILSSGED